MNRRHALLALSTPFVIRAARAQTQSRRLVAVIEPVPASPATAHVLSGLRRGLREGGFTEGPGLEILHRPADDGYGALPRIIADMLARKVDIIATAGPVATLAAKAATGTTPPIWPAPRSPMRRRCFF